MGGKPVVVVRAKDEERILHHEYGEKVEEKVHDAHAADARPNEFMLSDVAFEATSGDLGHGVQGDGISRADVGRDFGSRNCGRRPVPA